MHTMEGDTERERERATLSRQAVPDLRWKMGVTRRGRGGWRHDDTGDGEVVRRPVMVAAFVEGTERERESPGDIPEEEFWLRRKTSGDVMSDKEGWSTD